jgi:hypothetical protein
MGGTLRVLSWFQFNGDNPNIEINSGSKRMLQVASYMLSVANCQLQDG